MPKVLMLARREYLAAVKTKTFIIMLIVMPIMMGGSAIGMALLKDRGDKSDRHLAVIDRTGVLGPALENAVTERNKNEIVDEENGKKTKPAYVLEIVEPAADAQAQRLALSDRVRGGDLHAFLEIGPDVLHPGEEAEHARIAYYAEAAAIDEMRRWVQYPLNNNLRRLRALEAGVSEGEVDQLFRWIGVEGMGLVSVDAAGQVQEAERSDEGQAVFVPLILIMLMFMMFMMGAMPQLGSVMEEKQQRIAEVMLGSVRPFDFMMGKVLGGVGVTLTCITVYVGGGIVAARRLDVEQYVPYETLPWFFAFLILAILMFGAIFAALGSACNDQKEAQSMMFPAMVPMMLPMFILGPLLEEPGGRVATIVSLIPTCTPMTMVLRLASPVSIPAWQPWAGLGLVTLTALLAIWAGGRIFRVAILMQGTPPKPINLLRWMIKG